MSLGKPYYDDGEGHVIYHGDCRGILPFVTSDLVLTDPPYKHEHMDGGGFAAGKRFYREGALNGLNDFQVDEYGDMLINASPMLCVFHSRDLIVDYAALAQRCQRRYDLHVWWKTNAIPFTANTWKSDLEYFALIWDRKPGWSQMQQDMHSKVFMHPINRDSLHPAAKPIGMLRKYLAVLSPTNVCDPFMGSGTTLRACADLGISCVGIELEEKYCEIAAKRLEQRVLF